jgi:ketosteroid isomerase-like protein
MLVLRTLSIPGICAVLFGLLIAGCKAAPSPEAAQRDVLTALAAYDTLILRMDHARIGASFLADGETSDGDQAPIRGPEAIRAHLQRFAAFRVLANSLEADTTRVQADTAWQTGTYWQRVQVPSGDTVEVTGRFEVTWIQTTPGHWKIRRMHTFRPPVT